MSYLPHGEAHPSINPSLNLFNAENVDVSVKHGYYEQFYPVQPLSDVVEFKIFSNEDYFIDLASTFIDLKIACKKADGTHATATDQLGYENCILHNLFKQINVYINGTLVSTSNNLSNYASYIQFMLTSPVWFKSTRGTSIGYKYLNDNSVDTDLQNAVRSEYHVVGKINHEIFNIHQWLPPNTKIDLKMTLAPSSFLLRKLGDNSPDASVSITQAVLHVRKQQVMSSVALAVEKLRCAGNNMKLLVPRTVTTQRHIPMGVQTFSDSSFITGEIPSKVALAFVLSSSAVGNYRSSPHRFELFGLTGLTCKVNGVPLYNLTFTDSYKTLYELTMNALDREDQMFENGITPNMFGSNHGMILLDLSGTGDMSIVRTGTVRLECTFAGPLTESITLISVSQFETYWEVTPDGSVLLELAP